MPKALSLKYRPTKFSDLIGQDSISQTLSLALELDKVTHAYLFSGLRGSGKTSSARIFARALQCDKFPISNPCNECQSCKSALNNTHMDIVEMDAASSRSIDDIKNLIEQIQYRPAYGRFKVFIIDEVHMLTKEAFNALLKTLEEPPEYVKFILATTDPLKLPPTILSRTQHFRFKKIPQNNISTHLKKILDIENVKFEDEAINLISRNCGGSLRDALTLLEQAIIFSKENITLQNISNMLGAINPSFIEEFFNSILLENNQKIDELLSEFESYEAENIIDEMIIFLKNKMLNKDNKFHIIVIERFFRILGDAKNMLSLNGNSSFVLLLMNLKLKEALKIQEIQNLIAKVEQEVLKENNILENINTISEKNYNAPKETDKENIYSKHGELQEVSNLGNNINDKLKITKDKQKEQNQQIKDHNAKFLELIDKIYNRDYTLGEIFKNNIFFIKFENSTLTWESRANEKDKDNLKQSFSVIFKLAKEVFGENLKIKSATKKDLEMQSSNNSQNNESSHIEPEIIKDIEKIFLVTKKEVIKENNENNN